LELFKELLESWHIHNSINLYLLQGIEELHLASVSASKGRTVREQFAHIHNVRLMWLKAAAPELLNGLEKLEKESPATNEVLQTALTKSGEAMAQLLATGFASGKIKGFKPHPAAFYSYLVAHESHHRGQIMLTMKQAGHPVDKKIAFGLWEWGSR